MGTFTRNNTELAVDIDGAGQQHRAEAGGMTIALERWNAGLDTARVVRRTAGRCLPGTALGLLPEGQSHHALRRRSDRRDLGG